MSPSRSSIASREPVEAPDGTAARPKAPPSRMTSASTVGLPRLSRISRPRIETISMLDHDRFLPLRRSQRATGGLAFARASKRCRSASSSPIRASGTMFGPSLGARSGCSCVSMKTAGDADRHRGAREHRHELALAAAGAAEAARLLHRVGRVEHDRPAGRGELRQRTHVGHQRVVAEADAALAGEDAVGAEALELGGDLLHVPGGQELALLDVDRPAGLGAGAQQVGLAAEEGRDLQHVDHLGHGRALPALVDVGEHRQPGRLLDLGQDRQAPSRARCPRALLALVRFALSKELL